MPRNILVFLVVGTAVCLFGSASSADVPHMINYQGKLTTASGGCLNDTVQMTFTIYSDSLGTMDEWSETQMEVMVKDGIFNVLLGSVDAVPAIIFDGSVKYLGVQVESDPEMRPLKPMVSVGYAFRSAESDTAGFALSAAPDADWDIDTAGLNIYRLTGDVGVGTPSPQYKLDIRGTTGIDVGSNFSDVPLTISVPSDQSALISRIAKGGSIINVVDADGNIGIGTFSPQEKLDVAGTAQVTGFKMPTGASNGYVLTSDGSGVGTWKPGGGGPGSGWVDDGDVVRLETSTDSVGIGTSNPGAPLQVGSGSHAPVFLNTDVQIDHDDASSHHMEIRNDNGATGWAIDASGTTTFGPISATKNLYLLGGNSVRMTIDGSSGDIGIGTTSPGSRLEINGDGALQLAINNTSGRNWAMRSDNTGRFSLWDYSALNDAYTVSSSGAPGGFTFQFNGSVGIGTPSPGSKLEINGDGALQLAINNTSGRNWVMRSDNTGKFSLWDYSALYDAYTVSSSGAPGGFTFQFNGNVGIGTANPGAPLQVGSGSHAPVLVNTSMQVDHDDASDHNIEIRNNSGATGWRINAAGSTTFGPLSAGQDLYLLGGNSTRVTIDGSSGYVGVGTTNPGARLHVFSSENLISNLESVSASGTRVDLINNYNSEYEAYQLHVGASFPGGLNRGEFGIYHGGWRFLISDGGNVGIGTTSPQGALDVNSTTGALIVPRMTTTQRNALSPVNGMIIYNTTTNQFNFYENGVWVTK